jgi:hypothetical protein
VDKKNATPSREVGSSVKVAAIGCQRVDVVRLTDQLDMWIDDEGLYNSAINPLATRLAHHFQSDIPSAYRQPYFGTTVFLGINQNTGETLSINGAADFTATELTQLQTALHRTAAGSRWG